MMKDFTGITVSNSEKKVNKKVETNNMKLYPTQRLLADASQDLPPSVQDDLASLNFCMSPQQ